jgi:hypothetical protein
VDRGGAVFAFALPDSRAPLFLFVSGLLDIVHGLHALIP